MHRYSYLRNDYGLDNSGEETVDIKIREPITALWLELRCANGANHNINNPIHATVDAVELIDGSTVLWSLDGFQMLGMVCGQLGFMPQQRFNELPGDDASLALPILFGNFLGDVERSFDPTRFLAPQVRVKWNLANLQGVGGGGFKDGDLTMTLIAEVMEDAPSPRSMLMAKEVYTYTTVAGTEYVPLRRDYPYKGMMIRPVATTSHWWEVISNLKLDLDGGAKVPFDLGAEDFQYLLFQRQPRLSLRQTFWVNDSYTIYPVLKEIEGFAPVSEFGTDCVLGYYNYEYGQQTIRVFQNGSATTTCPNIGAEVTGHFPYHCIYIPFGDPLKPETWFNAPAWQSILLELLGATADRAVSICLLQDRTY